MAVIELTALIALVPWSVLRAQAATNVCDVRLLITDSFGVPIVPDMVEVVDTFSLRTGKPLVYRGDEMRVIPYSRYLIRVQKRGYEVAERTEWIVNPKAFFQIGLQPMVLAEPTKKGEQVSGLVKDIPAGLAAEVRIRMFGIFNGVSKDVFLDSRGGFMIPEIVEGEYSFFIISGTQVLNHEIRTLKGTLRSVVLSARSGASADRPDH